MIFSPRDLHSQYESKVLYELRQLTAMTLSHEKHEVLKSDSCHRRVSVWVCVCVCVCVGGCVGVCVCGCVCFVCVSEREFCSYCGDEESVCLFLFVLVFVLFLSGALEVKSK